MDKVIGVGKIGCGIADEFRVYPEYRIYKIGADLESRGNFHTHLVVDTQSNIQEYEEKFDSIDAEAYLENVEQGDEVLFIVGGGEPISGISLSLLEIIKVAEVTVLYVCPDRDASSLLQKRDDKIVFNILQEYARSGLLKRLFLVERSRVEEMIGDVAISEYEKSVYHFISYVVAMTNYFDHTEAVLTNKGKPGKISRIGTFGVASLDKDELKFLFPIEGEDYAHYYYGIPEQDLKEDSELMRKIKGQNRSFSKDNVDSCFSVYSTSLEASIVLCSFYSKRIQSLPSEA
jgi:hypothetical protein